jgi:hypothetical protein
VGGAGAGAVMGQRGGILTSMACWPLESLPSVDPAHLFPVCPVPGRLTPDSPQVSTHFLRADFIYQGKKAGAYALQRVPCRILGHTGFVWHYCLLPRQGQVDFFVVVFVAYVTGSLYNSLQT